MRLQHHKQWLRWVPFLLWVFGIFWSILVQEATFDVGLSIALITGPVGVGIPIVGAVMCHRPRTRRVYTVGAIAGGAAIVAMMLMMALAAVLYELGSGEFVMDALYALAQMLGMMWPFMLGALMTMVLLTVWVFLTPKPTEEKK